MPIKAPASRKVSNPLPESFHFGVANSDWQCEAFDQRFTDVRDVWTERRGLTMRGRATDFWNRYPEDIRLARDLGCHIFRFSVAWSRVEPSPGQFNARALDHYSEVVETIRAAGMEAMVTLLHWTWPIHIEERGGLTGPNFPDMFANYVDRVVAKLGNRTRYWVTFNEPDMLAFGYIKPWWQRDYFQLPGLPADAGFSEQINAVAGLMRNLMLAHTAARKVIKHNNPEAQVGANPAMLGLPVWLQRLLNFNLIHLRCPKDMLRLGRYFVHRPVPDQGSADLLIANLTMTRARAQQVDFSESYYATSLNLLVKSGTGRSGRDDLAGEAVAVVKTSTAESSISRLSPKAHGAVFSDYSKALRALEEGRVAAVLADNTILDGTMRQHPGRYELIAANLREEAYGIGMAKGNPQLVDMVCQSVSDFKSSGEWVTSHIRHFPGRPIPEPPRRNVRANLGSIAPTLTRVTPDEGKGAEPYGPNVDPVLRRIREQGYLVAAVKDNLPGFGYRDPQTGEWSGLEIDLARAVARRILGENYKVIFQPVNTSKRIPAVRSWLRVFDPLLKLYGVLSCVANTNWWYLGMAGKLPEFICPPECVNQLDFVGLDYYWGIPSFAIHRVMQLFAALTSGRNDEAPVWPQGLYNLLKFHAKLLPGKPIIIVENGSVVKADRLDRATYLRQHVRQIQRAVHKGIHVCAHLCWSITTNRELGAKFTPSTDFGLYHIDLDADPELIRHETESATAYRQIIADRGTQDT